jgi:GT2 family glycosyltransferase
MPTLTVIVPATNDPPTLGRCTAAIQAAAAAPEELVVVREPAHSGPAAARNAGAREATGEVVVFIDADIAVHRDAFTRIRETFAAQERLVAVFGSYDDAPEAPGVVSQFRNLLHHHVHQTSAGAATTFWGGIGAVRREAFDRVGGFDEQRFPVPSVEDIELGMRLTAEGALIVLDPRIQGTHLKHWSLSQMVRTDLHHRGIPWVELLLESRGGFSALNLGWRHRLSTASVVLGVGALIRGRPRVALVATGTLVVLNRSFYTLLARRRGSLEAIAGVGLHAVHHLTAAAAVPLGFGRHARRLRNFKPGSRAPHRRS